MMTYKLEGDSRSPFSTIEIIGDNGNELDELARVFKGKCIKIDTVTHPPEFWGNHQVTNAYTEKLTIKVANQKVNEIVEFIEQSDRKIFN